MSDMDQMMFQKFVHDTICNHPDWIEGTIRAMNYGALARVEKEVDRRAEADTALCFVLSTEEGKKAFAGLPEERKKRVMNSIDTGCFGETQWSRSLKVESIESGSVGGVSHSPSLKDELAEAGSNGTTSYDCPPRE